MDQDWNWNPSGLGVCISQVMILHSGCASLHSHQPCVSGPVPPQPAHHVLATVYYCFLNLFIDEYQKFSEVELLHVYLLLWICLFIYFAYFPIFICFFIEL